MVLRPCYRYLTSAHSGAPTSRVCDILVSTDPAFVSGLHFRGISLPSSPDFIFQNRKTIHIMRLLFHGYSLDTHTTERAYRTIAVAH